MDHDYAKRKLSILLRDIDQYTADEFRREMARTISGATGQDIPDDLHTLKAERDAVLAQNSELVAMFREAPELTFDECKKLFTEEIRQIQADYWRKGFIYGFESSEEGWNGEHGADDADINRRADKYAEKVQQGVEP